MKSSFPFENIFPEIIGNFPAKLALTLNLIDPKCGGVLLIGKKGVGKSTLLKLFKKLLKINHIPFIEIPLNIDEENLIGALDIEKTLKEGKRVYQKGILQRDAVYIIIDNLNLLPQEKLSLIFQSPQCIISAFNPEEGFISSHFLDRFGMCAIMENLKEEEEYKNLLKILDLKNLENSYLEEYYKYGSWIKFLRTQIENVWFSESLLEYAVELCLKNGVFSHRGEIFLFFAGRAFTALKGESFLRKEYLDFVAPLVFIHRKKEIKKKEKTEENKKQGESTEENKEKDLKENLSQKTEPAPSRESSQFSEKEEKFSEAELENMEMIFSSFHKEEIFEIGEIFRPKNLNLKRDRIIRNLMGKRTKSKVVFKGGRKIRTVFFSKDKDIDIFGTLKACAPFQKIRGRKDKLIIYKDDFRYKEKERKIGHLVVFVVDGSGSMAAQQRMLATKGAIFSLLTDCYQKRDRVAMILFRKFKAEIILPPTSSVEVAYKKLREIPTGGNTPLPAGLFCAYQLIKRHHYKFPQDRILLILITDGKANIPINYAEDPFKETKNICYEIRNLPYVDSVVIDTEIKDGFLKMDLARDIAEWLTAFYFLLEEIKAENLTDIIHQVKSSLSLNTSAVKR